MDSQILFKFLAKLIEQNLIEEKTKIVKFLPKHKIAEKDIFKKEIKVKKAIVKVRLSNDKFLLVEDLPINFFLSFSILIGDRTQLIEFENDEGEIMICQKNVFDKVKKISNVKKIKIVSPKSLNNIEFEYGFERPQVIREIVNFSKEKNKIELDKIHIVDSSDLENFIPTIKRGHFKIARLLKIPLIPLIENNYIAKSTININDDILMIKKLNPLLELEELQVFDFEKLGNKKLFKDVKKEVDIKVDFDSLKEKIENSQNNFELEDILELIKSKKSIQFSSPFSTLPIPLFKSIKNQKFILIKDKEHFCELTGREFKLDLDFLQGVFIQTLEGEKATFKNYFFNYKSVKIIDKLKYDEENITFETIDELIFKLIFAKDVKSIMQVESVNRNLILEIIKILKFLIRKTILKSVEFNKLPTKNFADTPIKKFYLSKTNSLLVDYEKFKFKKSKKELLSNTIREIQKIMVVINNSEFEFEHLYYYNQINLILLKILDEFDHESYLNLKKLFDDYFEENAFEIKKSSIDVNLEELIFSISLANKLSKRKNVFIKVKNDFDLNLLNSKIRPIKENPSRIEMKPNSKKIKEIFKYGAKNIISQLKNSNLDSNSKNIELKVKGKKINLNNQFFSKYEIYDMYKKVYENNFFFLAIRKPESTSRISQS